MTKISKLVSRTYDRAKAAVAPLLPPSTDSVGFDAPKLQLEEDRLDRAELAARTYSLLTELPIEWSVRVGLLGGWGEGKTSVANWVASKCADEGHLVVLYNPWNVKSDAQLWIEFAGKLLQALEESGIEVEGAKTLKGLVKFKKWADFPRQISEYLKASQIAFGVVENLLKITPDDIKRLRDKFAEKRVIVIIDDLDRTDPQLVPRLLLSLRELLDIPGFSFLLPFDHGVVTSALENYNKAWGNGDKFLEKILDFRLLLPETTSEQRQQVFLEELESHCKFIPESAAQDLGDVLPSNPRRVKALVRNLITLRREAIRHKPSEIDWRSVLFASMLRMESPTFFALYTAQLFNMQGRNPWLAAFVSKESNQELDEQLKRLLVEAKIDDENIRKRVLHLCSRWKSAGALGFDRARYATRLLDQTELLTLAEYDSLVTAWQSSLNIEQVLTIVRERSRQDEKAIEQLVRRFIRALFAEYDLRLNAASEAFLESDNATANTDAGILFDFVRALVRSGGSYNLSADLRLEVFALTLKTAFNWAAFRRNSHDEIRRSSERELLLAMLPNMGGEWINYSVTIVKQFDSGLRDRDRQELYRQLREGLAYAVKRAVDELLTRPEGVQSLMSSEIDPDLRCEILDVDGSLWQPQGSSRGEAVLSQAASDSVIQRNAYALLSLLQMIHSVGPKRAEEAARRFTANRHYIGALWSAAIARPLQFRNLQETRDLRRGLVEGGADSAALPVPAWLEVT